MRDRGRSARTPVEIPRQGWRDILLRVWRKIGQDNASLIAAGIALNALLAVFPALAVTVAVYGLFSSPAGVAADMRSFYDLLPPGAAALIQTQLQALASPAHPRLGFSAAVGAMIALWSARQGIAAVITATNIAYYEHDRRGFIHQTAIALLLTVVAVLGFLAMMLLAVAVPLVLQVIPLGPVAAAAVLICRWVLLWSFVVLALAVIYRYGPDREDAQWRWVTWGSASAATLWLGGSLLFALYVENINNYGIMYGALGGVVVLLMWFYLGGFALILGAQINAEMERQTEVDTTDGPPLPMGQRGAYVADTLGPTAD